MEEPIRNTYRLLLAHTPFKWCSYNSYLMEIDKSIIANPGKC
jgi:hypothetical protein